MKQEKIDAMMTKIDQKCKLPKRWNDFIKKQTKEFNYIIKDIKQKDCYCTNCQNHFYDNKTRVARYFTCPNCKKDFEVQRDEEYPQENHRMPDGNRCYRPGLGRHGQYYA